MPDHGLNDPGRIAAIVADPATRDRANFGRKPTPEEWQNLGKNQQGDKP